MQEGTLIELLLILIALFIIFLPFLIYHCIKAKNGRENLKTMSEILHSTIDSNTLKTKKFVTGYYRDKNVKFEVEFFRLVPQAKLTMYPSYIPQNRREMHSRSSVPRITEDTYWDYEKVIFLFDPEAGLTEKKILTREEMFTILDKMVVGALAIEKALPFYDDEGKEWKIKIAILTVLFPIVGILIVLFSKRFTKKESTILIAYTIFWIFIVFRPLH